MHIKLAVKSRLLTYFRIVYGNTNCHNDELGISVSTGNLQPFVEEMYSQLSLHGYVIVPCEEVFCKDCAHIYLNKNDKQKEYPRLKVYIHPNEMSGWAPGTHVRILLKIAEENSFTSNVSLVYSEKVYNISDEEYLDILRKAEPQIKEWLIEYKRHCRRRMGNPGEIFNQIFGIKRLSVSRLNFRDYVLVNYINDLWFEM